MVSCDEVRTQFFLCSSWSRIDVAWHTRYFRHSLKRERRTCCCFKASRILCLLCPSLWGRGSRRYWRNMRRKMVGMLVERKRRRKFHPSQNPGAGSGSVRLLRTMLPSTTQRTWWSQLQVICGKCSNTWGMKERDTYWVALLLETWYNGKMAYLHPPTQKELKMQHFEAVQDKNLLAAFPDGGSPLMNPIHWLLKGGVVVAAPTMLLLLFFKPHQRGPAAENI